MNARIAAVLAGIVVLATGILFGLSPEVSAHEPQKWDYRVVRIDFDLRPEAKLEMGEKPGGEKNPYEMVFKVNEEMAREIARSVEKQLDALGAEGWELCTIEDRMLVLKRPID